MATYLELHERVRPGMGERLLQPHEINMLCCGNVRTAVRRGFIGLFLLKGLGVRLATLLPDGTEGMIFYRCPFCGVAMNGPQFGRDVLPSFPAMAEVLAARMLGESLEEKPEEDGDPEEELGLVLKDDVEEEPEAEKTPAGEVRSKVREAAFDGKPVDRPLKDDSGVPEDTADSGGDDPFSVEV